MSIQLRGIRFNSFHQPMHLNHFTFNVIHWALVYDEKGSFFHFFLSSFNFAIVCSETWFRKRQCKTKEIFYCVESCSTGEMWFGKQAMKLNYGDNCINLDWIAFEEEVAVEVVDVEHAGNAVDAVDVAGLVVDARWFVSCPSMLEWIKWCNQNSILHVRFIHSSLASNTSMC